MMNVKIALSNVGGLSNTSKMPCKSYGIPAQACQTGGKLREVRGSTCSSCYACKGAYKWPAVSAAYYRRFDSLTNPDWVESMAFLINREKSGFFRWHDSGDLQSLDHLKRIIQVCELTPSIRHWLPTREKGILSKYKGAIPENLTIRLSAAMIDGQPAKTRFNTSTVHGAQKLDYVSLHNKTFYCKAYQNNGACGDCRACWDKSIKNVSYKKH